MPRLFDAYVIVDWSAAAKPVNGANSIWIGTRTRRADGSTRFSSQNPTTRLAARQVLKDLIEKLVTRGDKVLVGFDFAFGYPAGTAAAANLPQANQAPWRAMYDHLSANVEEREDNSNTRFEIAANLNKAISQRPHPFWGTPKSRQTPTLAMKKGDFSAPNSLPEHRKAEAWIKSNFKAHPKSVWQLLGAGAVGSQALLGIPTVQYLRQQIPVARIWPFETDFKPLQPEDLAEVSCVFAEIYPSTVPITPKTGEILDQAQVRILSKHLESLDSAGDLADAFGPPDTLSGSEIAEITCEEGWILAK